MIAYKTGRSYGAKTNLKHFFYKLFAPNGAF